LWERRRGEVKRSVLAFALMGVVLLLLAGTALARNISCNDNRCVGTNRSDTMRGTNDRDNMAGRGGNDEMFGGNSDMMRSGNGADIMRGESGRDRMYGGADNDTINGGPFGDRIVAGTGTDSVVGENGADQIDLRDGVQDSVRCGNGNDTVVVDLADTLGRPDDFLALMSCENVVEP
jgi:Ca2+-binding RTX toxin-like protein